MINKALIIGGSNGIGLAVSRNLLDRGYEVKILGIHEPDKNIIKPSECEYSYLDLRYPDMAMLEALANDDSINTLFISSGIGRVADFQYFHTAEIEKIFTIDTVSIIKIIKLFYDKLRYGGGGILLRRDELNHWAYLLTVRSSIFGGKSRVV